MAASCQNEITPESLDWKLAYQSFTFRVFTFEEGLQKANDLGLKYVEAYRGQELTPDNPARTHFDMDIDTREEMRQLLDRYQVKLINYGVVRDSEVFSASNMNITGKTMCLKLNRV